jgi:hypothetical protein
MSQPQTGPATHGRSGASTLPPSNQLAFTAAQQEQLFRLQLAKAVAENAAIERAAASAALLAKQQLTFATKRHAADMAHQAALRAAIAVGVQQAPV